MDQIDRELSALIEEDFRGRKVERYVLNQQRRLTEEEQLDRMEGLKRAYMFIPKGSQVKHWKTPKGLWILSWTNKQGRDAAIAFQGRAKKPLWHFQFFKREQMEDRIHQTIESYNKRQLAKQQERDQRKGFQHTWEVGTILYTSWGYDQTNVEFYQVTDVAGKSVVAREIAQEVVGHDKVAPIKGKFIGKPFKKVVQYDGRGGYIKEPVYKHAASPWHGSPVYATVHSPGH